MSSLGRYFIQIVMGLVLLMLPALVLSMPFFPTLLLSFNLLKINTGLHQVACMEVLFETNFYSLFNIHLLSFSYAKLSFIHNYLILHPNC